MFGYEMIDEDGTILGGAFVTINDTNINYLDFLFVRIDMESHGIGKLIWDEIVKDIFYCIKFYNNV